MSDMRSRVERQAENLRSEAQDTVSSAAEAAREMGSDVARKAGEMADVALTHGRKMGETAGELGTELRGAIVRSVERQPLMTVLMAAAAGLLLGAILRR